MLQHGICVGIDGSPPSVGALNWAMRLATATGARVRAVHVWQTPFVCLYPWVTPSTDEAVHRAWSVVRSTMRSVGDPAHVETIVARGMAGRELINEAQDCDLIVVGCTGEELGARRAASGEILIGSTARYVVTHAPIPAVAIPDAAHWVDSPQVVVGVDGSTASLAALRWASRRLPASATIHAVRAVEQSDHSEVVPIDYESLDPIVDEFHRELDRWVDEAVDGRFGESGRTVTTHIVYGYAQDALLSPGFHPDMIVVGEHGDTSPEHVLGSVSDHTLRNTSVPVVVVPAGLGRVGAGATATAHSTSAQEEYA